MLYARIRIIMHAVFVHVKRVVDDSSVPVFRVPHNAVARVIVKIAIQLADFDTVQSEVFAYRTVFVVKINCLRNGFRA